MKRNTKNSDQIVRNFLFLDQDEAMKAKEDNKSVSTMATDMNHLSAYDDDEKAIIKEENVLIDEMNINGEKFRTVSIVYDKVIKNIQRIIKRYAKENNTNNTNNINTEKNNSDEDPKDPVVIDYEKLLDNNSSNISKLLENNDRNKFENILKDKFSFAIPKSKPELSKPKNLFGLHKKPNEDYFVKDEDGNEEERLIKEDVRELNRIYFEEVS